MNLTPREETGYPRCMLIPVILSGGAGTRLWPVSREAQPKPFMHVGGKSLLARAHERALAVGDQAPLIVTNHDYYFMSRDALADQSAQPRYLLEPAGRNTAPAIALAALWAAQIGDPGGDPCLLVMPADHLIADTPSFAAAVGHAAKLAKGGAMVLFGMRPLAPETGFGYIEMGDSINPHAHAVRRFVEKPDAATAAGYLAQGNYCWNSGIFCFKASVILDALASHAPGLLQTARTVWLGMREEGDKIELPAEFAALENISIDYAVMEKAENIVVIPGDFGWSDIGSWNAVSDALTADGDGNTTAGPCVVMDSHNTHIESKDRTVVAFGLDNLLVIDTPDALLVADKSRSQDIGKVVRQLKDRGDETYRTPRTVARPWGTYTVVEEGPGFKIKRIVVKAGRSLSLQMHHRRSEHWVVVSGIADVTLDGAELVVRPNESTYIPIGAKHRLANSGTVDLVIIEVQCGSYVGEDDIVRFTDNYGRA
jgi:mannose-1-phosphate guanylyltransferase/mannose-6-phosphate isomerase